MQSEAAENTAEIAEELNSDTAQTSVTDQKGKPNLTRTKAEQLAAAREAKKRKIQEREDSLKNTSHLLKELYEQFKQFYQEQRDTSVKLLKLLETNASSVLGPITTPLDQDVKVPLNGKTETEEEDIEEEEEPWTVEDLSSAGVALSMLGGAVIVGGRYLLAKITKATPSTAPQKKQEAAVPPGQTDTASLEPDPKKPRISLVIPPRKD